MKVAIVGTGYVGLTVGAGLADIGHEVRCVDIDSKKIKLLNAGSIPIYEPGLEEMVRRNRKPGRLEFSTAVAKAMAWADIVLSAVGTPPDKDHRADLTAIREVSRQFGLNARSGSVFVNKSTVPVGTGKLCASIIADAARQRPDEFIFDVASNPEFLREGNAVHDCVKPDRIIVGTSSQRGLDILRQLYQPVIDRGVPFFPTTIESAEIIKYASNALLATKISFMNEIARLCELVGADVTEVERGVGLDSRIGRRFLHAGLGYGGSCFPKDVDALIATGEDHGHSFRIIKAVRDVNQKQKLRLFELLQKHIPDLRGKKIALWGLSFKPKTDDIREAPSLLIIEKLISLGAKVTAYDPAAMPAAKKMFPKVSYVTSAMDAVEGADALLIVTEWDEFRSVDLQELKKTMSGTLILDGRNIWHPAEVRKAGFRYESIGRP